MEQEQPVKLPDRTNIYVLHKAEIAKKQALNRKGIKGLFKRLSVYIDRSDTEPIDLEYYVLYRKIRTLY